MKIQFKQNYKNKYINSRLASQNSMFKFIIKEKNEINKPSIISKIKNIINPNNKHNQIENKKIIRYNKREFIFYTLINLLLLPNIFKLTCQNIILSEDSIVNLKISGNGQQKIFNRGTNPNEIWIDNIKQKTVKNTYDLNPTNIISLKWTVDINNCEYMFSGCNFISGMNFTHFDSTKCSKIFRMFENCHSLISLDLSGFITSNYTMDLSSMFSNCFSLISLNLSTFDTSGVLNFGHMFHNCSSLVWIDASNFNTEKALYLDNMFYGCKQLISLNLSNFITSNAKCIDNMFYSCESLKIIDFSNLDVTSVTNINNVKNLFQNCKNLGYINIKNLKPDIQLENKFFDGSPKNLIVCIDDQKTELIINALDNNENCRLIYCYNNSSDFKYKMNTENDCFTESCVITNYKYEYNYKCYPGCLNRTFNNNYICEYCHPDCEECEGNYTKDNSNCKKCISKEKYLSFGNCINNCSRGFYINKTTNQKTCKCELKQCLSCSKESLNQNICTL